MKLKKSDDSNKEKYDSIKNNLLKQIKYSDNATEENSKKENLTFIYRTNRFTNSMLKSILKNSSKTDILKKFSPKSKDLLSIEKSKTISKKNKDILKKKVWHERNIIIFYPILAILFFLRHWIDKKSIERKS